MNPSSQQDGQIITFYSFKGGVGRTMTLANIAFLSALNGLRVLVMDWDLEAPGLAYYFRCLLGTAEAKAMAELPGVLDVLWDWSDSAKSVKSDKEFDTLLTRFKSGEVFDRCTYDLYADENGGALDFIGAGSSRVGTGGLTYEDALSQFAWPAFFEEQVGGVMLQELRRWAKAKYDVVLVDSRTGLADVAGVCTMQLPDKVGLCFVLNRQNIDGVARVAAAIRSKREEQVGVRAVPMRVVAGSDSGEASDAQAKAIAELTRIGRFSRDAAREDMRQLSVFASNTIPFYETLAPILTDDPTKDPLTLNYATVASHILGRDINARPLDREWVEQARSRLQPRLATIEYVTKLRLSEPSRMIEELQRLIEGALDAALDGRELDSEYVQALVDNIAAAESIDPFEMVDVFPLAIELLRTLMVSSPNWRLSFIATLDRYVDNCLYMLADEEGLALLDELDALLAEEPTIEAAIKRISHKRLALPLLLNPSEYERVRQTSAEIREMIAAVREKVDAVGQVLAADQLDALVCAEIDSYLQSFIALERRKMPQEAADELKMANDLMRAIDKSKASPTLLRIGSQVHTYLASVQDLSSEQGQAARHAVEAMRWTSTFTLRATRFCNLADVVLRFGSPPLMLDFCEAVFAEQDRGVSAALASANGRSPSYARRFLSIVEEIVDMLHGCEKQRVSAALFALGGVCERLVAALKRRIGAGGRSEETVAVLEDLQDILSRINANAALGQLGSPPVSGAHPSPKADA